MKPRWLRHMIATPSPSPTPPSSSPRAIALERECTSEKLSVPASSSIIGSSGWFTAAPAIPAAGDAPHRASRTAIAASLSGRTGRITPASASTFTLNGTSLRAPSGPSLILRVTWSMGRITESAESFDANERSTSVTLCAHSSEPQPGDASLIDVHHRDGHAGDALPPPDPAETLVRSRLHAHARRQRLAQDVLHLAAVRANARLLADERRVDVLDAAAEVPQRHRQQIQRVRVPPLFLLGREERPQVTESARAQDRVDDRVRQDVRIGMAAKPALVRDLDAPQDEPAALDERMHVIADPDSRAHPTRSVSTSAPVRPMGSRRRERPLKTAISPMPQSFMASTARS